MRTLYLNLGMPKTGSTSIQRAFSGYETETLICPQLIRDNHSIIIKSSYMIDPKGRRPFKFSTRTNSQIRKIQERRKQLLDNALNTEKDVFLSGETVLGDLSANELNNMFSDLNSKFDLVKVICYVRPVEQLAASAFQQRVKGGSKHDFSLPIPRYQRYFGKLLKFLPRENITFVRFNRADLDGGDVVTDISKRLGVTPPKTEKTLANQSLSTEAVSAMYVLNKRIGRIIKNSVHTQLAAKLLENLISFGDTKFGFSEEIISAHVKACSDDIAWMEKLAGFELTGCFKPVPDPVTSEKDLIPRATDFYLQHDS